MKRHILFAALAAALALSSLPLQAQPCPRGGYVYYRNAPRGAQGYRYNYCPPARGYYGPAMRPYRGYNYYVPGPRPYAPHRGCYRPYGSPVGLVATVLDDAAYTISRFADVYAEAAYLSVLTQAMRQANTEYVYKNGNYYKKASGNNYVPVDAPAGALIDTLPEGYASETVEGETLYRSGKTYYKLTVTDEGKSAFMVVGTKK